MPRQSLARLLKIDLFAASLCLSLCIFTLPGCFRTPQVTADASVFSELDALYTAVTAKRSDLLEETYSRISQLHSDQRLSGAGFRKITTIVELARQENWQKASEQLYQFMRAQQKRPGSQVPA